MFTPLRLALYVAMISLVIYIVYPLVVFINDIVNNPECVQVSIENIEYINETTVKGDLFVNYCSSVTLRSVKVEIGPTLIIFDQLLRGKNYKEVILYVDEIEIKSVEFTIAGIYRVKLTMVK